MKHIDKVFKDKLFHRTAEVPDDMWDKIAPAIEENSGRALIWFWMAGILALLLGGMTYLYFTNSDSSLVLPGPLAENVSTETTNSNTPTEKIDLIAEPVSVLDNSEKLVEKAPKKGKPTTTKVTTRKVSSKKPMETKTTEISESLGSIDSNVSNNQSTPEIKYGKPANLVITKSYISDKGSIIEKSKIGSTESEIEYNVFINSEGLNAGTLMRIVEPLENIPLPAFQKPVKKKILKLN